MKTRLKKLRQNKDFRMFCFTVFNAGVAFAWVLLTGITWPRAVVIAWMAIPFLNAFTKYMNTRYFGDMGVTKKKKAK